MFSRCPPGADSCPFYGVTRYAKVEARQKEFGDFLRSRRERLTPAAVGLSNGFHRRTPGLRREEVALLAGAGTT